MSQGPKDSQAVWLPVPPGAVGEAAVPRRSFKMRHRQSQNASPLPSPTGRAPAAIPARAAPQTPERMPPPAQPPPQALTFIESPDHYPLPGEHDGPLCESSQNSGTSVYVDAVDSSSQFGSEGEGHEESLEIGDTSEEEFRDLDRSYSPVLIDDSNASQDQESVVNESDGNISDETGAVEDEVGFRGGDEDEDEDGDEVDGDGVPDEVHVVENEIDGEAGSDIDPTQSGKRVGRKRSVPTGKRIARSPPYKSAYAPRNTKKRVLRSSMQGDAESRTHPLPVIAGFSRSRAMATSTGPVRAYQRTHLSSPEDEWLVANYPVMRRADGKTNWKKLGDCFELQFGLERRKEIMKVSSRDRMDADYSVQVQGVIDGAVVEEAV